MKNSYYKFREKLFSIIKIFMYCINKRIEIVSYNENSLYMIRFKTYHFNAIFYCPHTQCDCTISTYMGYIIWSSICHLISEQFLIFNHYLISDSIESCSCMLIRDLI